jgi:hypothetical protein
MSAMSDLEDLIEGTSGVRLHRKRVLTAFSHVEKGPLLDMLFKLTRPPLRKMKAAAKTAHPAVPAAPTIVRRGMVDYRHEHRHIFGEAP